MAYFVFSDGRDTFAVQILDPAKIEHARALIAGTADFDVHIGGVVTVAPAEYNVGWSYSLAPDDVTFYDVSAEVADAPIRDVEEFVNSGRSLDEFLPGDFWGSWATFMVRELREMSGTDAPDVLTGTRAADIVFGGLGADTIRGADGADYLIGGNGNDLLFGGVGHDKLGGGEGQDRLDGGEGADVLDGGSGADRMYGGAGNDVYFVDDPADATVELPGNGTDLIKSSISVTLRANIEQLKLLGSDDLNGRGNADANLIIGNSGSNSLAGLEGDDVLRGDGGDDRIDGGNDRLDGGAGADLMIGGTGDDIYFVDNQSDRSIELEDGGNDGVYAAVDHVLRANMEWLHLTGTATKGFGNELANVVSGNASANVLRGYGGDDLLYGDDGQDLLVGGSGRDRLYGGSGADVFLFDDGDVGASAATADVIRDFAGAEGDRIHLGGIDANDSLAGDQAFAFIGTAAFSGAAGELRYQQVGTTTYLQADRNGDGTADLWIRVDGLHTFDANDLVL